MGYESYKIYTFDLQSCPQELTSEVGVSGSVLERQKEKEGRIE